MLNSSAFGHSGRIWVKGWKTDDTGSLTNPSIIIPWANSSLITFPDSEDIVYDVDVNLTLSSNTEFTNKYIYIEMFWEVTTAGSDATAGLKIEETQNSCLDIPNNSGLATYIIMDLLSGSGITTGSITWNKTPITVSYNDTKCFDAIKEICGITGQDFYIDTGSRLQVFDRSANSTGITYRTGSNILSYKKNEDITSVKSDIFIKGAAESYLPWDGDYWTEHSGSGWNLTSGSDFKEAWTSTLVPTTIVGSKCVLGQNHTNYWLIFEHNIIPKINLIDDEFTRLNFWGRIGGLSTFTTRKVRLKKDSINYFEVSLKDPNAGQASDWTLMTYDLGAKNVTGSFHSGEWRQYGNLNWKDIQNIEFYCQGNNVGMLLYIDGLYFGPIRWTGSVSDPGTSGSFGYRPYTEISDYLHSNTECQLRAQEVMSGSNSPIKQIVILTTGSESLIPGYTAIVDIPSEGINTTFDMLEIQHMYDVRSGFLTELQLTDQKYIRDLSKLKSYGVQLWGDRQDISKALLSIKVIK